MPAILTPCFSKRGRLLAGHQMQHLVVIIAVEIHRQLWWLGEVIDMLLPVWDADTIVGVEQVRSHCCWSCKLIQHNLA